MVYMNYTKLLIRIVDLAVPQMFGLDRLELNAKSAPDRWSKKEIIGHLIDSAYNNHQRFLRAESQGNLIFPGYNQVEWVRMNNYQARDHVELIDLWSKSNRHLAVLINQLNPEFLIQETTEHHFNKMCFNLIPEGIPSSLSYLIWDYLSHLEHHLGQIIEGYEKLNPEFH